MPWYINAGGCVPKDNLNGAQILGRVIRADHVSDYKKKQEEDEEEERKKREARDTGRGPQEDKENRGSRWDHDKFDDRVKRDNRSSQHECNPDSRATERRQDGDYHARHSKGSVRTDSHRQIGEIKSTDHLCKDRQPVPIEKTDRKEDLDRHAKERRSSRYDREANAGDDRDRREEKRSRRIEMETDQRGNRDERDREGKGPREKLISCSEFILQHHRDP
ncbi:Zinc finger CCCH domain-containing protein [Drosera capensis]